MMAFFMVMWLTSPERGRQGGDRPALSRIRSPFYEPSEGANSHSPAPRPASSHRAAAQANDSRKTARRAAPADADDAGRRQSKPRPARSSSSPDIRPSSIRPRHDQLAELLPSILGKPQKIEIRGHASRRPLPADSPFKDAWQLSYARCLATMQYLQEHGIAPSGCGSARPASMSPSQADGPRAGPARAGRGPPARRGRPALRRAQGDLAQRTACGTPTSRSRTARRWP